MHYDVNGVPLFDGKQMNRNSQFSVKNLSTREWCYLRRIAPLEPPCMSFFEVPLPTPS